MPIPIANANANSASKGSGSGSTATAAATRNEKQGGDDFVKLGETVQFFAMDGGNDDDAEPAENTKDKVVGTSGASATSVDLLGVDGDQE